jgi:hypothetical protein
MAASRFGLMSDSHSTQLPKVRTSIRSAACTSRRRPESRSILPIAMSRSLASWIRSSSSGLHWIARASRFPFPFRLSVLQGFSECVQFDLCHGLNACPFLTFFESRCYSFRTSEATFSHPRVSPGIDFAKDARDSAQGTRPRPVPWLHLTRSDETASLPNCASANIPSPRRRVETTPEEQSLWSTFLTFFPFRAVQMEVQAECIRR